MESIRILNFHLFSILVPGNDSFQFVFQILISFPFWSLAMFLFQFVFQILISFQFWSLTMFFFRICISFQFWSLAMFLFQFVFQIVISFSILGPGLVSFANFHFFSIVVPGNVETKYTKQNGNNNGKQDKTTKHISPTNNNPEMFRSQQINNKYY